MDQHGQTAQKLKPVKNVQNCSKIIVLPQKIGLLSLSIALLSLSIVLLSLSIVLQQKIGKVSWIGVKKFLRVCKEHKAFSVKVIHNKKLLGLGLDERNITGSPNVITNLSSHNLTSDERSALNKGPNFGILPLHFYFLKIQASFERLYHEIRSYLSFKNRIEFERMIFNLNSKYKSG